MQERQERVSAAALLIVLMCAAAARAYDPNDETLATVLPPAGTFEPFYVRGAFGAGGGGGDAEGEEEEDDGSEPARAPHGHGSFYQHRHPALVDAKNAAAYGFRFDGGRRFNYD